MHTHELKISPEYFSEVINGNKTFEVRRNDRNYSVGDTLLLREFVGNTYTGRNCRCTISYILNHPTYCPKGYIILAIKLHS